MSEPMVDPEKLAALIDGRLDARERAEIMAQLNASEEAREVYADAITALRELEDASAQSQSSSRADITPINARTETRSSAQGTRRATFFRLAAAAVIILAVGGPFLWMQTRDSGGNDPGRFAGLVTAQVRLPADWESMPWGTTRGSAAATLSARARAARLGSRITDLEFAAAAQSTASARVIAEDIAALLSGVDGAALSASMYRDIAADSFDGSARIRQSLAEARQDAAEIVDDPVLHASAWLQAARVAAALKDATFFKTGSTRATLATLVSITVQLPEARIALDNITKAFGKEIAPDWTAIERDLTTVLKELAR